MVTLVVCCVNMHCKAIRDSQILAIAKTIIILIKSSLFVNFYLSYFAVSQIVMSFPFDISHQDIVTFVS